MAVGDTFFESDGKAVTVDLLYTVIANQVAYVDGWLGITARAGVSGGDVALTVDRREYQFIVPSDLGVVKGDDVYITVADLTGHTPDSTAYSKTSGAGKQKLFKATAAQDANNVVTGILYGGV